MQVRNTHAPGHESRRRPWLRVDHRRDLVAVIVAGGAAAERAEELWESVEHALEVAGGRAVIIDLTGVTGFDLDTMDTLCAIVRTALRRRDDVEILLQPDSGLDHYSRYYGLDARIIRSGTRLGDHGPGGHKAGDQARGAPGTQAPGTPDPRRSRFAWRVRSTEPAGALRVKLRHGMCQP